ncbi:MAG: outer membrane lipoprotein carrier protein LolA [Desulfobulbus sp.]|nr:outer membrane lipoprotein carrier protein LolA [Desulfobulbus sp.]
MMKLPDIARLACLLSFLACLPLFALPAWAEGWQPAQLMELLAQKKTGKATFTEKKTIGILDQPVVSSGKLSFTAPDKLEKITLTPQRESLLLDGDTLTIERQGKQPMTVNIKNHPEAAMFIESIRGTLAGDLSALERFYRVELSGAPDHWQLKLTPRQEDAGTVFSSIRIAGSQADVKTIHLEQRDGDQSVMTITPIPGQ